MKRHECCKTCGFSGFGYMDDECIVGVYFCEINGRKIEYPRKMGGRDKCPCYMNKAEYRKAVKKMTIENHVYPQKSEIKGE